MLRKSRDSKVIGKLLSGSIHLGSGEERQPAGAAGGDEATEFGDERGVPAQLGFVDADFGDSMRLLFEGRREDGREAFLLLGDEPRDEQVGGQGNDDPADSDPRSRKAPGDVGVGAAFPENAPVGGGSFFRGGMRGHVGIGGEV